MHRIELPGGAWADIRDPEELSERHRRPVKNLASASVATIARLEGISAGEDMAALGITEEEADRLTRLQDATIVAVVAAWSYDLPVTADALLDLPGAAYDALAAATAKTGAEATLDTSPNPTPEPGNPTGP